ncbi:MAG: hypothetical protein Q8R91_02615 [Candidatus Omnitrophota bacterium]|nr:hypothetical protein [Candidatus Omnitrophota bacterium]
MCYPPLMEVYVTRHARNRMRLYEIPHDMVERALEQPDDVTTGMLGASHAWKRVAPRTWLRVTFTTEGARRIVITVTPKSQPPGGPHAH